VIERPIRLLLDASAIVAFTRGSIDVGETIAEVYDDGAAVGLPILCLVEAVRSVAETDQLDLLVAHPATEVFAPAPEEWRALAAIVDMVGRMDCASAVLTAIDLDCLIMTNQPGVYGGLAGGGPIIPF